MYRKPGASGVLQGVLSGPYTGGRRLVLASKLPRAARQRLADVLGGRTEPMPILYERPHALVSSARATWAMLLGVIALSALIAVGFGDPRAAWSLQPESLLPLYVAIVVACGLAVLTVFRRHALASGTSLAPGRYLLPLDIVEVPKEDENGDQIVVVRPLGDARDVRVRRDEVVVVMADGEELRFALRSERDGEVAARRLEHAQRLLEDLSYSHDLERALAHDAFFDVRADASWPAVAPDGPESARAAGRRARRAWLHGRLAGAAVVAASTTLGVFAFYGRNFLSDRALYLRALRAGTAEQLDAYLVRGRAYRPEAIAQRQRLLDQREELAKRAAEARRKAGGDSPRAEWELTAAEAAVRRGTAEACAAALRARAPSPGDPRGAPSFADVPEIMQSLLDRATRSGDPTLPVRISIRSTHGEGRGEPRVDERTRAIATFRAFERIFSEACPAAILKFVVTPESLALGHEPGLDLRIDVAWPDAPTWKVAPSPRMKTPPADGKLPVFAPTMAFEVVLRGAGAANDLTASFRLSMPPPPAPSMSVRERSLFVVTGEPAPEGTFDLRVYDVLSARAFDRLYDEVWGMFFAGDPRVPLREPPAAD
ncbi:MAG: hypothetical protein JST00_37155 [Deltaproteobacteria bacterium]|nr:hypothetical protein [Deltaproteobacteria bacterium]